MSEDWVAIMEEEITDLQAEVGLDSANDRLYTEVDQLTNLVIECRRHALSGCGDRVVEITKEFADE
jgi:hypothetical protein